MVICLIQVELLYVPGGVTQPISAAGCFPINSICVVPFTTVSTRLWSLVKLVR